MAMGLWPEVIVLGLLSGVGWAILAREPQVHIKASGPAFNGMRRFYVATQPFRIAGPFDDNSLAIASHSGFEKLL